MNKTVSFKMPNPKAKAVDDWIADGVEPHLKTAKNEGDAAAPAAGAIKRLTVEVSADLHSRIRTACAQRGNVMADEIRQLLEAAFPNAS